PQHRFFDELGADDKERQVLPGFYHDTLGEKERHLAVEKVRAFVLNQFSSSTVLPLFKKADQPNFTAEEAAAIAAPLPRFSFKRFYWSSVRFSLRVGGWFSKGIWLGHKTGFDSGSTLDYVYENYAYGRTPLGRAIDRAYLDTIGWRGIRERKIHIEHLLRDATEKLRGDGKPVRVLDIAAGHGRYILNAFENAEDRPDYICLRDYSERNVKAGAELIERSGLKDKARFVKGDAFDRDSIAELSPRPTLGVVSGLYELFANNDLVRRSLDGLSAAIEEGGYLIYTGQPWHPQLEFIGRALTSHRQGQPWVMRRRTQAELDQLVAEAGFEKVDQWIDDWGIFSVSLARKIAA
ncbi:MAG: class I SAM-dependent methyltransferase family protein, partial [Gammaproteobacteria bacterium]